MERKYNVQSPLRDAMPTRGIHEYWVLPALPPYLATEEAAAVPGAQSLYPWGYSVRLGQGPQHFSGILVPT